MAATGPEQMRCCVAQRGVASISDGAEFTKPRYEAKKRNDGEPDMTTQPTPRGTPKGTPKGAWQITFLLFLFMVVNFADKIVVGLAGACRSGRNWA